MAGKRNHFHRFTLHATHRRRRLSKILKLLRGHEISFLDIAFSRKEVRTSVETEKARWQQSDTN